MKTNDNRLLADLVKMDSPDAVLDEVKEILALISPGFDAAPVESALHFIVRLYGGDHPLYRACNTDYHDLEHVTGAFIAMARLMHGALLQGRTLPHRHVTLGLISTLFHDVGYIQEKNDVEGTGAKYTLGHVQRSMDRLEQYGSDHGLSSDEIRVGRSVILCTDLNVDIASVQFPSREAELLGKMLATADLLSQMADRTYLEKLLFLYYEFREGNVGDFQDELDMLEKSVGFFDFISHRLEEKLDGCHRFMKTHFSSRWGIEGDLYMEAIDRQKDYLCRILDMPESDPRQHLKRSGIVDMVREKYGSNP